VAAAALTLALGGCTSSPSQAPAPTQQDGRTGQPAPVETAEPRQPYVQLADAVVAHGAQAWVEADLVKAWLAGSDRYNHVLDVVVAFASRPGIAGVKIADELGYGDGLDAA
jgi:type IV pilus biogenesis protein CpaD/CtpE